MSSRHLMIIVLYILILIQTGCDRSAAHQLGLTYVEPKVPDSIEQKFYPKPNQKAFETLPDGQSYHDMHVHYKLYHKAGWECGTTDLLNNNVRDEEEWYAPESWSGVMRVRVR